MKKAQQEARLSQTTSGDRDELTVTLEYEGGDGPSDALFAEIAFIVADSHRVSATASPQ